MTKVKCGVDTCSYNQQGGCYVSEINVGGKGATNEALTCCGTFLNKQVYSNLAGYTCMRGEADTVLCRVDTCKHNGEGLCTLKEIQVGAKGGANIYTETECLSYDKS